MGALGYIPAGYSGMPKCGQPTYAAGYIPAGYSGFLGLGLGLGDAAYDAALAAYQVAHETWQRQMLDYQNTQGNYQLSLNAYNQSLAAYQADLARWTAEVAAYNAAYNAIANQGRTAQMAAAAQQASAIALYPGVVIPAGYAGCVSQAQHNAWQSQCDAISSVRGLGADPTGPACGLALLPVCAPAPLLPAAVRPRPQPPAPFSVPAPVSPGPEPQPPTPPPPSALGPPPQQIPPPSVTQDPYSDTTPLLTPSPTPAATTASAGILSNGLLLVALAGGGYLLYRSLKKPKASAA